MTADGIIKVGKIVGVHGIRGEIRVHATADTLEHFHPGSRVFFEAPDGSCRPHTIRRVQPHKHILRMAIDGIEDRNAAEAVVGTQLCVPRSALPETDADTWYWCDLIGLDVYDADDAYIGRVTAMIETGSNDVFVVMNGDAETLIPAVASVVTDIDTETGRMCVDLPEGL